MSSCGKSSNLVTPIGPSSFCKPASECEEPEDCCEKKLAIWERDISAIPADDHETAIKFFVAKQDFTLIRVSGEIEGESLSVNIRIDETHFTTLNIDQESVKSNFKGTKKVEVEVTAGDLIEVFIPTIELASGESGPANLEIELQGLVVVND